MLSREGATEATYTPGADGRTGGFVLIRSTIVFLALGLVVAGVPFAGAEHDPDAQKRADCENADNQGWIGYNSSRTGRYLYENATNGEQKSGFGDAVDGHMNRALTLVLVDNCEGEQWDGEDSVNNAPNNEPTSTDGSCARLSETDARDFAFTNCQRADINDNTDGPTGRAPLGARVSGTGSGDGAYQEAYVGLDIMLVGRAAVYAGTCSDDTSGLEGAEDCKSDDSDDHGREARTGVYVRDNTPNNVLAVIISTLGLTRGEAGEGDCTQENYYDGVESGDRSKCVRDNTAISGEFLLP